MRKDNRIGEDWKTVSLVNDLPYIKTGVLKYAGKKKYYSTGSIKTDSVTEEGEYSFNEKPSRANRIVKFGDVLQARMKNTDKVILIDSRLEGHLFSTGFFQIRPVKGILSSKYIFYYLSSLNFNQVKDDLCSGSTQSALNDLNAKKILISLPPFLTQERIVSKIEELLSELDEGIENLKTVRQQLKTYRQSVLRWGFEGKFTNENIEGEKLPEGWKWVKLGEVSQSCLGKMLDKQKNTGTLKPYLRNINVRWNSFKLDNLFEMPFKEKEHERFGIEKGDLIICEGGEPGRAAIWKDQIPNMKIQKALHRVRFKKSVCTEFFLYYLNLISSNQHINKYFTGTTIKHLTGQSLKKILFPLPSIEEQLVVVQEIESRLSVADKMEETITQSLQQAEALRQSILKKAFEGKLL